MPVTSASELSLASERSGFECRRCGRCCQYEVLFTHDDIKRMESHTSGAHPTGFLMTKSMTLEGSRSSLITKENGKSECLFLEGRSCSIHDSKPLLCKMYPFFPVPSGVIERAVGPIPDAVKVRSERNGAGYYMSYHANCPGVGNAPRVDWQLILRMWEQYEQEMVAKG